ncbi:MAG: hypothetical protein CR996_01410 [Draconibacterium sp.]|nr:MAG: hypothetical protein CR996_01410 [Draconibacterium sp.]PIF05566.1 MAG: hypothetical protein CSA36_06125 [Draconibacterium sp.]
MKKVSIFFAFILFIIVNSCNTDRNQVVTDEAFGKYVTAFTSGNISKASAISVHLAQPVSGSFNQDKKLFGFKPMVKGTTVLVGDRIIEFRPDEPLKSGTRYSVDFHLGKLLKTDRNLAVMPFEFSTIEQSFSVTPEGLKNMEDGFFNKMEFTGYLLTADVADAAEIEKVVNATYDGKKVALHWQHNPDQRRHFFSIDSLVRDKNDVRVLEVSWNGRPLDVEKKGEERFDVPQLSAFNILNVRVLQEPEQHIEIRFSDPVQKSQDLTGLFALADGTSLRISNDGNIVNLWPSKLLSGEIDLSVFEGIKNIHNAKITATQTFRLLFSNLMPEIRLIGKGIIVPQSTHLEMPFEAVSLKALEVRIVQLFKDNVQQFFQENQFDGESELNRTGRVVYTGTVPLKTSQPDGYLRWNTYKINISDLIDIEPGAIYNVRFGMKKAFSAYGCDEDIDDDNLKETDTPDKKPYQTFWDSPGWYSDYYYPPGYDWEERDNPCHVSYYNSDRFVSRNIFASELGIIAKEGQNHMMKFAVTNILTTTPEVGVELRIFNFQHQLLETVSTDNNGFAAVEMKSKPFLVVAQKGKQFGYLRLDDGTALSTSNFNVSGQVVTEGLKGFIYGERGVWRPGDTLYLNFIAEKENHSFPEKYPVVFQLINPNGQVVDKQVKTENINGFYSFQTKTDSDAPTGNWQAQVTMGSARFSKRIKIETVKPNRLKIDLKLPETAITPEVKSTTMEAMWLFGSPARSLKAKVDVLLVQDKSGFKGYEDYSFTDPATRFSAEEQTIFEGQLNEQGKVDIPLDFNALENAPGMLKTWFTSRVFEEGGDFSINVEQAKLAPFKRFVGIKMPNSDDNWYKTDTEYHPEIVLVDANGNPAKGDKLQVKLYKIDWRWWWESGSESLAHYISGSHYRPVKTWQIDMAGSKNTIDLNVKYRNWQDNGRYLLWVKDETTGHASGTTFYMSKWGGWRSDGMADGATLLTLRTDKDKYNVGEKIVVTLPSSKVGKALVSLENGTEVTDWFWVETTDRQTSFTIDAKPEMAPNFYIHVSLIQPYGQTENDAPLRLYGVIPVEVENPLTILKPIIDTPEEIEPEKKYTVKVSEAQKRKMTYTLAVVDEGLLGLTNFRTPDPHAVFYAREALGVLTWDLYDLIAGAYGARLEKAFAVGGDADLAIAGKKEVNRFKPVVQFAGPFTLEKGKTNKHELVMPNYVGSVRVMVVAGNDGAYGNAEKELPVRKGLMLLATLPRVLAPGEEVSLPVNIFAMKNDVKNVDVSVKTNGLVEVVGTQKAKVLFDTTGDKMAFFKLKTKQVSGTAKIKIEAQSGRERASYEVEMAIRNPNSPVTIEKSAMVEGNKNWSAELQVPGTASEGKAWVEVSSFPSIDLTKYIDYLTTYPHGCLEQVVSAAFPQIFMNNLVELSADEKMRMEDNVRVATSKLPAYQVDNGGFANWPGGIDDVEWSTSYAGHFMLKAESEGYSLPMGMKNRWLGYQRTMSRNWSASGSSRNGIYHSSYDLNQAYRLYTLALAGEADLGAMNRLREKDNKPVEVSWRLAAAYVLAGQLEAANTLVNGITTDIQNYQMPGPTFGTALRDKAMILETLVLLKDKQKAFAMLKSISDQIKKQNWLSTQTAAWCITSAGMFARENYKKGVENRFKVIANGEKTTLRTELPVVQIPVKLKSAGVANVEFSNQSKNACFVKVLGRGIPVGVDDLSVSEGLLLNVRYVDTGNNEVDPKMLKQGTDFKMVVTIKNPGTNRNYDNLALTTVLPSGWEILNKRMNDIPEEQNSAYDYQDIRDDRVYTYFRLSMNQQRSFTIYLNAAYAGRYYQPPVSCEDMYDNAVHAKNVGRWVEVVK